MNVDDKRKEGKVTREGGIWRRGGQRHRYLMSSVFPAACTINNLLEMDRFHSKLVCPGLDKHKQTH